MLHERLLCRSIISLLLDILLLSLLTLSIYGWKLSFLLVLFGYNCPKATSHTQTRIFVPLSFPVHKCSGFAAKHTSSAPSLSQLTRMSRGFLIHKLVAKMLQKMLASWARCRYGPAMDCDCEDEESRFLSGVPEDVKKGHFVVHVVDGGELRRFVLELSYLAHPGFLKLLEQAESEFGFKQTGILAIPCRYSDLQSVLQSKA